MSRTSALGTKLTALAMSTLLATSTPLTATVAYAEENSDDADATVEQDAQQAPKDEIVYTRTDANGAASGTYVVNYFNTPQAVEVADPGTYDKVTNLSTTEQLEDADGTVNLTTLAGQPFYYQGDLADGTQLPWKVDITYTLDGKEVSPEDLSGADGDLDIELKIAGLDDDSATADFAKSFVLQAQGTFADANFNLTDAGDATISTVGDKTLVTYLQLPGTDGDYHIKGKATDFNYSGWQIAAMPLSLDLNVADYDTSQLTDAAGELESATTQLADGGSSLRSGLSQLNTGAATAATWRALQWRNAALRWRPVRCLGRTAACCRPRNRQGRCRPAGQRLELHRDACEGRPAYPGRDRAAQGFDRNLGQCAAALFLRCREQQCDLCDVSLQFHN